MTVGFDWTIEDKVLPGVSTPYMYSCSVAGCRARLCLVVVAFAVPDHGRGSVGFQRCGCAAPRPGRFALAVYALSSKRQQGNQARPFKVRADAGKDAGDIVRSK